MTQPQLKRLLNKLDSLNKKEKLEIILYLNNKISSKKKNKSENKYTKDILSNLKILKGCLHSEFGSTNEVNADLKKLWVERYVSH